MICNNPQLNQQLNMDSAMIQGTCGQSESDYISGTHGQTAMRMEHQLKSRQGCICPVEPIDYPIEIIGSGNWDRCSEISLGFE